MGATMERITYSPGDRIFIEGDPAVCAFLIMEGRVELTVRKDDDVVVIGFAEKGEMLGEMALINTSPRSATARCTEERTVMIVPKDDFERRLKAADPVIQHLLRQLTRRLRDQTRATMEKSTVIR